MHLSCVEKFGNKIIRGVRRRLIPCKCSWHKLLAWAFLAPYYSNSSWWCCGGRVAEDCLCVLAIEMISGLLIGTLLLLVCKSAEGYVYLRSSALRSVRTQKSNTAFRASNTFAMKSGNMLLPKIDIVTQLTPKSNELNQMIFREWERHLFDTAENIKRNRKQDELIKVYTHLVSTMLHRKLTPLEVTSFEVIGHAVIESLVALQPSGSPITALVDSIAVVHIDCIDYMTKRNELKPLAKRANLPQTLSFIKGLDEGTTAGGGGTTDAPANVKEDANKE